MIEQLERNLAEANKHNYPNKERLAKLLAEERVKTLAPETLAREFAAILKTWLTPEEQLQVIERNKTEEWENVCHSHDFCDSNMAMAEALEKLGVELDIQSDTQNALWNSAWGIAKNNGFWFHLS